VRILDKNLSGTRTQLLGFYLFLDDWDFLKAGEVKEIGKFLGIRKVNNIERLGRTEILGGKGGRKFLEV
jgi:hypothetical protein